MADSRDETTLIESVVLKSIHTLDKAQPTHILSAMLVSAHLVNEYLVTWLKIFVAWRREPLEGRGCMFKRVTVGLGVTRYSSVTCF